MIISQIQQLADHVINNDGGLSANYVIIISFSIIGGLISVIGFLLHQQMRFQFTALRTDLQGFAELVRIHDKELALMKKDLEYLQKETGN